MEVIGMTWGTKEEIEIIREDWLSDIQHWR